MQCGSDTCGGVCGRCAAGYGCNNTQCVPMQSTTAGTCQAPLPLITDPTAPFIGIHRQTINLLDGLDTVTPSCFPDGTARDQILSFTTPTLEQMNNQPFSIDARSVAVEGQLVDTVIELRTGACEDGAAPPMEPAGNWCNDESIPPGNFGSRVVGFLKHNTTYWLIVTQYPRYA